MNHPPIIILAGPTASGKSGLALELAEKRGGVIINADSQQMYAELRVLTARPTPAAEARVPHRLYGALSASEACSAGKWLRLAKMEIDWARSNGQPAIIVGGTGLYLKALTEGLSEIPDIDPAIRAQAQADLQSMGNEAFYRRIAETDPEIILNIRPSDPQRMTRAWEVFLSTGKPLSWWQKNKKICFYESSLFRIFHVVCERGELYARCDARLLQMLKNGALDEVRNVISLQLPDSLPAMHIIGVPEFASHLRGECTLEKATARAQQATRNYVKRQLTWFNNQGRNYHPIDIQSKSSLLALARQIG